MSAYLYIALAQDERIRKQKTAETKSRMNGGDLFMTTSALPSRSLRSRSSSFTTTTTTANSIHCDSNKSRLSRTTSRSTTDSGGTTFLSKSGSTLKQTQTQPNVLIRDGKKWVYDTTLQKYVAMEKTPYQEAKLEYLHNISKISSMGGHEFNSHLNQSVVQDLFNLEMLRYSYFEGFEYDGNKVVGDDIITASTSPSKQAVRRPRSNSVISSIGLATTSSTVQEEEEETNFTGDSMHNKHSSHNNMRSLLKSDQFWNTCYQDLRFESMAEANDIYDQLPSMHATMTFYIEFIDYVLINLHILKPSLDGINDSIEYNQLAKQYYLYFNKHNVDHLYRLKMGFGGRRVNDKVIETIIANFDAVKKMYRLDTHLVSIWKRFLQLVAEMMTNLSKPLPPVDFTQQPIPPFAKKAQQQSRQTLVDSRSSSLMSQMSKREGSVWTMDTVVSSIDEIESRSTNGSTRLAPLSETHNNRAKLKVTPSKSDVMEKTKKKSFFDKFRGK